MKHVLYFIISMLVCLQLKAQNDSVFHIDSLPHSDDASYYLHPSISLQKLWKYNKGDNMQWADSSYDDSNWKYIDPALNIELLPENTFETIGWFRIHLEIDSQFTNKTLGLMITQSGASEVYLDGKLLHCFGKIDKTNIANEEHYDPQGLPVDIRFEHTNKHILAIRYANAKALINYKSRGISSAGFDISIGELRENIFSKFNNSISYAVIFVFYFAFFIALCFMHFVFFLFYKTTKSNLYYSIFAGTLGLFFLWLFVQTNFRYPDTINELNFFFNHLSAIYMPALIAMLYTIFYKKIVKIFWFWLVLALSDALLDFMNLSVPYLGGIAYLLLSLETLRIIIVSIYKKRDGSWIIGSGVIITIVFFMLFTILSFIGKSINFNSSGWGGVFLGIITIYATVSIPISMSIYLAREFSRTSKHLAKKLIEVETLSTKTIEQEKEKQKILESQKETLEIQVKERTSEISLQKNIIEEKNKDITDSINYAKSIQKAILPTVDLQLKLFPKSFILFKPKDIVSGDFYWLTEKDGKKIIAACDCTGHGVPGALMSMIGSNLLHQIVNEKGITTPNEILNCLNTEIRKTLKQEESSESRDGMDIAVITFNSATEIEFAGAQRPLWIVEKTNNDNASSNINPANFQLTEIKGNKFAIGGVQHAPESSFTNHSIQLKDSSRMYIFSDGFADQFDPNDKKLMTSRFKKLLVEIQHLTMREQESYLADYSNEWRAGVEQIDDILVVGIGL
jgi:serine phosphatase RsbU (regulator of sigma subunit)